MKNTTVLVLLTTLFFASIARGQDEPVDEVGQKATKLEAELSKFKDTSPEAANLLVQLVDLYHADGRAFGLVRAGQKFVNAHPSDARHQAVMLKLLDGLEGLSRNKEFASDCRQFLTRYPKAAQCPQLEIRLAQTLGQMADHVATANAYRVVWRRQGNNQMGREAGATAIRLFAAAGGKDNITAGAELADEMLGRLPNDGFALRIGWRGFNEWRRISEWAKSNVTGKQLLAKGIAKDRERTRQVHWLMGMSYRSLAQYTNSVASLRQALAMKDDQQVLYYLIEGLHNALAPPNQIEPLATQYMQKYPTRDDRLTRRAYVAHAYLRAKDVPRALAIYAELLPQKGIGAANASTYVQNNGTEPAQAAISERVLRDAIKRNKEATFLRYTLAFNVYRDRIKDLAKCKQVLRELIAQPHPDDSYARTAGQYLLDNAADDNEFRQELARLIQDRRRHVHQVAYRNFLAGWQKAAARKKDLQPRAALVKAELDKQDRDPQVALWLQNTWKYNSENSRVRDQLLTKTGGMSEEQIRRLWEYQAYSYRHYVPAEQRPRSAELYGNLAKKYPTNYQYAVYYLQSATDYAPKEIKKLAAQHMLKQDPPLSDPDVWRRLMLAADQNEDANLAKQAYQWMQRSHQKFGDISNYATYIGDVMLKLKLENEAVAHWQKYMKADPTSSESRDCASRLLARMTEEQSKEKLALLQPLFRHDADYHGRYAGWMADLYFKAKDLNNFERVLRESRKRQDLRAFVVWDLDIWQANTWIAQTRVNEEATDADKKRIYTVVRDLRLGFPSAAADLALIELAPPANQTAMQRILAYQQPTRMLGDAHYDWDSLVPFAQKALEREDYVAAATLVSGMLSNIVSAGAQRQQAGRDMISQAYSRMGAVGLTIDEDSPLAPLLQAALYLRLGDPNLAFDTFITNRALFNEHRNEVPTDLLTFVCERLTAAGGDENHEYVEETLRGWLVKHSESKQHELETKAEIQLLLARNYFKAQRYDVARSEFTTCINRYPETPQAIEAEFGIGQTFMSQKVYDQAELVFEKLADSQETNVVIRAEFLRGVLYFRRGDRDEARDVFRSVLDRVPDVELANEALFNLSEVYGIEERYLDQLNLLRTVGRLGSVSKRRHSPGMPLSIVVHDSDLGISRGHNRIKVIVKTHPGGDEEIVDLTSAGAGKGLFRVDLDTTLGKARPGDRVLQLTGRDTITSDYPEKFKAEFKNVPLSDVEIKVASSANFEISSSKIIDAEEESFSERLAREARQREESDQRVSQGRPVNQVKPGNLIYMRVKDGDRDLSDETDQIVVKLTADSGDQVQATLLETTPHSGVFEGTIQTGELPAGALASDTAIEHSPLMAIDRDSKTVWVSEPDGATPKTLTVDMKDLKEVGRARIHTPTLEKNAPIRAALLGSNDGEFWFRLAGFPELPEAPAVAETFGQMKRRVYDGNYTNYSRWNQVVDLSKNGAPIDEAELEDDLSWVRPAGEESSEFPYGVIWHGHFVQPRASAVRFRINGQRTALAMDGLIQMELGAGGRTMDIWLEEGVHELTVFSAVRNGQQKVEATLARARLDSADVTLAPFHHSDLDVADAKKAGDQIKLAQPNDIPLLVESAQVQKTTEQFGLSEDKAYIGNWRAVGDVLTWEFEAPQAGAYDVKLDLSHNGVGGRYAVQLGDFQAEAIVPNTGGWNKYGTYVACTILVDQPGKHSMQIKPLELSASGMLMNLRGVSLQPAEGPRRVVVDNAWEFRFQPIDLRYVRFSVDEYLGEAVAINHFEVGLVGQQPYIPTETDVLSLANNNVLEIAGGDQVTASYMDEFTLTESGNSQLLSSSLTATYFNAEVSPVAYDFERSTGGGVGTIRKELLRVDAKDRIIVEIVDYDEDRTAERDTVPFTVEMDGGQILKLEATETENYSGIFTKEIDTSAAAEKGKLTVKIGDQIRISYLDTQNTFPGHSVQRESLVYVNAPTEGLVRILPSRVQPPPPESKAPPQIVYLQASDDGEVVGVALNAPITIEVIDPDQAKDTLSSVVVKLTTTDGATVDVRCVVSERFAENLPAHDQPALLEGRFVGQVILQLGGKDSPDIVPLTSEMPRNLVGRVVMDEDNSDGGLGLVTRVLNMTGKDVVKAAYADERRPGGKAQDRSASGRLLVNGRLACTDREYEKPVQSLHLGERLFIKVEDADRDTSDERDVVRVDIATQEGEKEEIELIESLAHSGVFTGSLMLKASDAPKAGNLDPEAPSVECYFGETLFVRYIDEAAVADSGTWEQRLEIPVVIGTDGLVKAFTKTFNDEDLAVETKFHIAESYFELFKSHRQLGRGDDEQSDLESGRRVLREVMEDFPDPKYTPRIAYLLGQFAQELEQWNEAINSYDMIIQQFPDHSLAADAQYKSAQCHEEAGDFDQALEGYVTLAATYPKSPLIANVMIRISDHFYKGEEYDVAAQVGEKFLERFEGHEHAPRMAFRIGQCYYKAEEFRDASDAFDRFSKTFPEDKLCAQALFWSGEAYRMGNNNLFAFQRYNRCRWDFPSSEAARYARGRLTLPEMLQQFEASVNSLDMDN